jgi:hemerythrin-like domain-containing protein
MTQPGSFTNRRHFLNKALNLLPPIWCLAQLQAAAAENPEGEVSPAEDLMREHGALNRILLIYDEVHLRLSEGRSFDPKVVIASAGLISSFIENYHEKLEEQHLFPRFEKAGKLNDLVAVLRQQHKSGREITAQIVKHANQRSDTKGSATSQLARNLKSFTRMYRPHEAREDTILFPAFRRLVSDKEYKELGEQFEDKEHELFGKEGFENNVKQIADIERQLCIYELSQFTPKLG